VTHPVFFSVAGTSDRKLAEATKALLPDNLVYLYTRTGEEGVSIRREIEAEIQGCLLFVVFWSDDYLASQYATVELALFRKSAEAFSGREILVVPTTRRSPNPQHKWKNPISGLTEHALGRWRLDRALDRAPDSQKIAEHVRRRIEQVQIGADVLVPRLNVQQLLRGALSAAQYRTKEFVFVAGFEGDGRRTAIAQYMDLSFRHLTRRNLSFDSFENPDDLLPRLLETCGVPSVDANHVLDEIRQGLTTPVKELRRLVHSMRASKSYLVVAMDRFTGVDVSIGLPSWVADVFAGFNEGNAPLVFFVTSIPIYSSEMKHYPYAGYLRVPGLDDQEMEELVFRLGAVDPNPSRWNEDVRNVVKKVAGSSPALCQLIMRRAAFEPTLDFLEQMAKQEEERFAANMTALLGHIIKEYEGSKVDLLALRVIEKLGVASKAALDDILPSEELGQYDLFGMLRLGIVERLADDLLRIPPLIQRRLGYVLLNTEIDPKVDELIAEFGRNATVVHDHYGPIYFSNKAAAAVRSGDMADETLTRYVTLSMLFRIGRDRYAEEDYGQAYQVLLRAMDRLDEQPAIEPGAAVEIARYFGLSAARQGMSAQVKRACVFLEGARFVGNKAKQGQAMAEFLRGFELRLKGDYEEALVFFENADQLLKGAKGADRQHGAILTEISRALLRVLPPRYDEAVRAAERAYMAKDAAHNLSGLIKARIERLSSGRYKSNPAFQQEVTEIRALISQLTAISKRVNSEFDLVREAELEVVLILDRAIRSSTQIDFTQPIALLEQALRVRPRPKTQAYCWKLKVINQKKDLSQEVARETAQIISLEDKSTTRWIDAQKLNIMAVGRTDAARAQSLLRNATDISQSSRRFIMNFLKMNGTVLPSKNLAVLIDRL
jgi:tetratricopeptide (TPR) repeat protein